MIVRHANGTIGFRPADSLMESNDRAAARYGAVLGLDPLNIASSDVSARSEARWSELCARPTSSPASAYA